MRITLAAAVACLAICGIAAADQATAAVRKSTEIPAQGLAPALTSLAKEFDFQVLYRTEVVGKLKTQGVSGAMTAAEALEHVLSGTGLTYKYLDQKTVTILPVGTAAPPSSPGWHDTVQSEDAEKGSQSQGGDQNKSLWDHFRLAQATQRPTPSTAQVIVSSSTSEREAESGSGALGEIVVTAEKREEKLIDVPSAVSAVTSDRLQTLGLDSISDIANIVPGLSVVNGGAPGKRQIVLRGLTTNFNPQTTASSVATYIDDMPFGLSSAIRSSTVGLDLSPYDIAGIEVLRGPQGTLYGTSSLGGIIKYITPRPDLEKSEVRAGADVEAIDHSGQIGRSIRGSISTPLIEDKLAVRVSGFYADNPGFVNNVLLGEKDTDHSTQKGGLLSILWQPTEDLTVRGLALTETTNSDNVSQVTVDGATMQPLYGKYDFSKHFPESFTETATQYGLTVDWRTGFATATNTLSWAKLTHFYAQDLTGIFGAGCASAPAYAYPGCPDYPFSDALALFTESTRQTKVSDEIRLASNHDSRLDWLVGVFYTKELSDYIEDMPAYTASIQPLPQPQNDLYNLVFLNDADTRELAGFVNANYKLTDTLELGSGARYSHHTAIDPAHVFSGVLYGGVPSPGPSVTEAPQNVTTWKVDVAYRPAKSTMIYAQVSTGYRAGGGCPTCGDPQFDIPGILKPDRTTNYELGVKGEFAEHRLYVDASIFYINWRDVQTTVLSPKDITYTGNGGNATSSGLELSSGYNITPELLLSGTLSFTDAKLSQDSPGVGGLKGDQLPGSPRWAGSFMIDYAHPLGNGASLLLGSNYHYRDKMYSLFAHTQYPYPIGVQNVVDGYAGVKVNNLTVRLNVKNMLDEHAYAGLLYVDNVTQPSVVPIQPRTFILNLDVTF